MARTELSVLSQFLNMLEIRCAIPAEISKKVKLKLIYFYMPVLKKFRYKQYLRILKCLECNTRPD